MTPNQEPRGRAVDRRRRNAPDAPEAPRHRIRSWRTQWLPTIRLVAIALAVVLVSGISVAAVAVSQLANQVSANSVDITNGKDTKAKSKVASFDGGFNVLIAGVDNSEEQAGAYGERDTTLNDVNILLHVSADHKSAVVLSMPRDLVISQPECTNPDTGDVAPEESASALNTSFNRGGLGCVVSSVQELTGLTIGYAGLISFQGTVAMADAVGGVPICLNEAIKDPTAGLDLPAGANTVSGETALSYLRSRHGVGDGSDLSRISSQQAYMSSLMRVMKSSETLSSPSKLAGLANAAATNLKLSESLANVPTMVGMALALKDLDLDKLVFVQFPSAEDPDDSAKLVPSTDLADELLGKIQSDQPFTLDADSLGDAAAVDPAAPAPAPAPEPAPATEPPATPAPDGATPAPAPPAPPEEIAGLRGQTAQQETCTLANDN